MPPRSVAPATPPSGAGSPQTRGAGVDYDPRREPQTGTRKGRNHAEIDRRNTWLRRKVRQVCDGGPRCRVMYLDTVDPAISNPSLSRSPWMRGAPHNGFSVLMSSRNPRLTL